MKRMLCLALVGGLSVLASPVLEAALTFGYFGSIGPARWGDLSPDWKTCSTGREQSPVDFGGATLQSPRYRFTTLVTDYGNTEGEIFNNGHTIEVETKGRNTLTLGGVRYDLLQFHFHMPSEHTFQGRGYDMELHLVHKSADGRLAVVGVFLQRAQSSGPLAPIFDRLPNTVDVHEPIHDLFDPSKFLPRVRTHYRYAGSLTTPPCSEGVSWNMMAEIMPISDDHLAQFVERVHSNARPVQRLFR